MTLRKRVGINAGDPTVARIHELLPVVPAWYADALCAQTDPEAFFPEKGGSMREAKAVCADCPVREKCLAYALEHGWRGGIWGGKSDNERRKLRTGGTAA